MNFLPKDFETLHKYKVLDGLDIDHPSTMYFFCLEDKMIFIKKSRRFYKIMASSSCPFEPIFRENNLDILYHSTDFNETVKMFMSYVSRLVIL